jgi:hypothetical protein
MNMPYRLTPNRHLDNQSPSINFSTMRVMFVGLGSVYCSSPSSTMLVQYPFDRKQRSLALYSLSKIIMHHDEHVHFTRDSTNTAASLPPDCLQFPELPLLICTSPL